MTNWEMFVTEKLSKFETWIAKKWIYNLHEFKRRHQNFKIERYVENELRTVGEWSEKQARYLPYKKISTKSLQKARSMKSLCKNEHL